MLTREELEKNRNNVMTVMENRIMQMCGCDRTTANLVANEVLNLDREAEQMLGEGREKAPGKQVTERDGLISLLEEARDAALDSCGSLNNGFGAWYADYLLAHGVRLEPERERTGEGEKKEDLRKVCVLTCVHDTRYGSSVYGSVHATDEEALAHVEAVMKKCDFEEDKNEYFNSDIDHCVLDVSKLERAEVKDISYDEMTLDEKIRQAVSDAADRRFEKVEKNREMESER